MDFADIADAILSAARWYHEHGKWNLAVFLVMPDHLHFIGHFPYMHDGHAGRVPLPCEGNLADQLVGSRVPRDRIVRPAVATKRQTNLEPSEKQW